MKRISQKLLYFWAFFSMGLTYAQVPSSARFLDLVFNEDIEGMKGFFAELKNSSPTFSECKIFLEEVSHELAYFYGLSPSKLSLKKLSKNLKKSSAFSITLGLQSTHFSLSHFLIKKVPYLISNLPLLHIVEEDLPTDFVIGLVEILGGSLLMIIPYGPVQVAGGALIADGIHRIGGSVGEIDQKNKETTATKKECAALKVGLLLLR